MLTLGTLGFTAPMILTALAALPVLWWLLRAVPPAPVLRRFPGIVLLLGLREKDPESQRTPWWLLLLRVGAVAALILALAGPVLNPRTVAPGEGPLLVLMDASWASARDWPRRVERVGQALSEARRTGRPVAVVSLTAPPAEGPVFRSADYWQDRVGALAPEPYAPPLALPGWLNDLPAERRDAVAVGRAGARRAAGASAGVAGARAGERVRAGRNRPGADAGGLRWRRRDPDRAPSRA
jgi:hypothetical protein